MHSINTILFDWDGTLIDTAQRAFNAFVKQFDSLGIQIDPETYERIYSPDWYRMYEDLGLPREKWKEADDLWLVYYGSENSKPVPGVRTVLDELVRRDCVMGIVTSGTRDRVLREIHELGFGRDFRIVICSEDVANRKPHPEGLDLAIRQLHTSRDGCCYVGDSPDDIEMGKRAGVMTVGICSGYPTSRNLAHSHPDLLLNSLGQILEVLSGSSLSISSSVKDS